VARSGRRLRTEDLTSAGGIVYRHGDTGPEVVLCGRRSDGLWGLPKGTPVQGETLEQTARREVREETGLQVEIERPLGAIEYWFTRPEQGLRFHKIVHHYLMTPTGGSTDQHDHEYDLVEWCPAALAVKRLTYSNEAEILRRALGFVPTAGEPAPVDAAHRTAEEHR
jgi:8-oxo-dGTP pyrophosphatase MutT (NUDIX family)